MKKEAEKKVMIVNNEHTVSIFPVIMVDIVVFNRFCYGGRLLFIRVLIFVIVIYLALLILIFASKIINYLNK